MSEPACNADRLLDLAEAVCDKTASQSELAELDSVLLTDEASRRGYLRYCRMHVSLKLDMLADEAAQKVCEQIDSEPVTPAASEFNAATDASSSPIPLGFFSTTLHGTVGYFSSGWPVAYLVATVICGVSMLVGSLTPVSRPEQIAKQSWPPTRAVSESKREIVGRITGMADCQWVNPATAIIDRAKVPLGRKYTLVTGLMEIAYDTGARVILQGPVTYEVTSENGGFLSVGKLTGKVEGETANGLVVRTPTATVTDLGTEFGVEVGKDGNTVSHVFRGSIKIQISSSLEKTASIARVLHQNESARVERSGNQGSGNCVIVVGPVAKPVEFVREISKRTDEPSDRFAVVAFWQFDDGNFLADSSGHGHTLVNSGAKQVANTASFDGSAMMHTIDSVDLTPYTRVRVSWSSKAAPRTPNQILWEHGWDYNYVPGAIVASIEGGECFAGIRNHSTNLQDTYRVEVFPLASDTWENYVVEFDRTSALRSGIIKVFKDGVLIGRGTQSNGPAPASFASAAFHIGAREGVKYPLVGQIDNLTIEGQTAKTHGHSRSE